VAELPPALRAFLDGDATLLPGAVDDAALDALIAQLLDAKDAERLSRLAAIRDKRVAKAARRALHILRARGVRPSDAPSTFVERGPYRAEESAPREAPELTVIDGESADPDA
jgi:hypothetical protein